METEKLQNYILTLLEPGIYKTTAQVIAEFRIEYAAQWKKLELEGEMLFGCSCSSVQQPSTRISQVLLSFSEQQCLCIRAQGEYRWSKPIPRGS